MSKKRAKHFVITAGGTREYIDPVRYVTNASSGKMGYSIAAAASRSGHKVTLISASEIQPPVGVEMIGVDTAREMFEAVKENLKNCDCLIMTAAVSDYTPARPRKTKIKKTSEPLEITLKPTVDILAWAGRHKKQSQYIVGFALEDKNLRASAEQKLKNKNADMIIANSPDVIGSDRASVQIKTVSEGWVTLPEIDKAELAEKLFDLIIKSI